ncbi:alpha/beta hydrolase [Pseudonocardia sp.]|jgi:pimeloyl-ACP methyl ester carboxylesterase|uniref:alpha/beta hydrolase n=1 Tax=Pseudonocardia sp. TaxID=60912 RepID=UPI003D1317F2
MTAALVLVHGAWHGAWAWDSLRTELPDVETIAVDLPSSGPDPTSLGTLDDDVAVVRAAVAAAGRPVVVVGHSYGGVPITEGLQDTDGVARLVYLTAMMMDVGHTVAGSVRGQWPSWWDVHEDEGYLDARHPEQFLYGDVDPAVAEAAVARLQHQSLAAYTAALTAAAWRSVPSTYIVCENDAALAPRAQDRLAQRADRVVRLSSAHSPFLSHPEDLAALLREELAAVQG